MAIVSQVLRKSFLMSTIPADNEQANEPTFFLYLATAALVCAVGTASLYYWAAIGRGIFQFGLKLLVPHFRFCAAIIDTETGKILVTTRRARNFFKNSLSDYPSSITPRSYEIIFADKKEASTFLSESVCCNLERRSSSETSRAVKEHWLLDVTALPFGMATLHLTSFNQEFLRNKNEIAGIERDSTRQSEAMQKLEDKAFIHNRFRGVVMDEEFKIIAPHAEIASEIFGVSVEELRKRNLFSIEPKVPLTPLNIDNQDMLTWAQKSREALGDSSSQNFYVLQMPLEQSSGVYLSFLTESELAQAEVSKEVTSHFSEMSPTILFDKNGKVLTANSGAKKVFRFSTHGTFLKDIILAERNPLNKMFLNDWDSQTLRKKYIVFLEQGDTLLPVDLYPVRQENAVTSITLYPAGVLNEQFTKAMENVVAIKCKKENGDLTIIEFCGAINNVFHTKKRPLLGSSLGLLLPIQRIKDQFSSDSGKSQELYEHIGTNKWNKETYAIAFLGEDEETFDIMVTNATKPWKLASDMEQLEQAERQLIAQVQSNVASSQLQQNVNHTLRGCAAGVSMQLEVLGQIFREGTPISPQMMRYFSDVKKASGKIEEGLSSILEAEGNKEKVFTECNPYNLLLKVVEEHKTIFLDPRVGKQLKHSFVGIDTTLNLPTYAISTIVVNLLSNARKYGGDVITLRAEIKDKKWLQITVHDNGLGVKETERERIFKRFTQQEEHRKLAGTSGIGLAHCKELAEELGGKCYLDPSIEGTNFVFTCPSLSDEDAVKKVSSYSSLSVREGWSKNMKPKNPFNADGSLQPKFRLPEGASKVLIVEDQDMIQDIYKELFDIYFEYTFYKQAYAMDEAWEQFERDQPDVVFLDTQFKMEKKDNENEKIYEVADAGHQLLKRIRDHDKKTGRRTWVIALTAALLPIEIEGKKVPIQEVYLKKGYDEFAGKRLIPEENVLMFEHIQEYLGANPSLKNA